MEQTLSYAEILKKTVQDAAIDQPRLQAIKLYPVCDIDSGHFLVLATGWDKQRWIDNILFHARLVDNQIIIEEDNFEESLTQALIAGGVRKEDIVIHLEPAILHSEWYVSYLHSKEGC
ncbi:element excision factor XisI family protein [Calothrix sp. PCC 7507]|uniref:element excision factor XisI family protein n=1 Tax=Calothrix sp. PCC 7507 TaxID=99598 RepID=UPI00029F4039|nr:element excision factor XisI family protein [Calothrix sp. PCC 7507]AFY34252.1 XisI protein [Calothrix sp. PCC 7507]